MDDTASGEVIGYIGHGWEMTGLSVRADRRGNRLVNCSLQPQEAALPLRCWRWSLDSTTLFRWLTGLRTATPVSLGLQEQVNGSRATCRGCVPNETLAGYADALCRICG